MKKKDFYTFIKYNIIKKEKVSFKRYLDLVIEIII